MIDEDATFEKFGYRSVDFKPRSHKRVVAVCDESENIDKNGKQKKLSVHHVDMNKNQGCDGHEWKLIPTCMHHHGVTHNHLWMERITYLLRLGV